MKTKLIIFDYDGVIVDTTPFMKSFYDLVIQKYNKKYEMSYDIFRRIMETEYRDTLRKVGFKTTKEIEQVESDFLLYMQEFRENIPIIKGMKEVIESLWKNYKLAIVSNAPGELIVEKLKNLNLYNKFELIADISFGRKPAPTQIKLCLDKLNIKPEEAVMIGDMDGDIKAAKNAELKKCIAVTFGFHHKDRLVEADCIANSPQEILTMVE